MSKIIKCIPSSHSKGHFKNYSIYTNPIIVSMLIIVSICETSRDVIHIIYKCEFANSFNLIMLKHEVSKLGSK